MKKIYALVLAVFLCTSPLFGDEVDSGLSIGSPEQLKSHTRAMIQAGVASTDALKMTKAMEQNRFQVETIIRSQEIVMKALREGLPAGPVMNKAHEGMAKGAREQDVVNAMEKTWARYSHAYRTARNVSASSRAVEQNGNTIAEGMAAGLKTQDCDRIADKLRQRDQDRKSDGTDALARESFMTAREMVRYRVSSEAAAGTVCAALEHAYQARDMERLRTAFMKNARYGNAAQLANEYAARIRNGMPAGELEPAGRYGNGWSSGSPAGSGAGTGSGSGAGGQGSGSGSGGSGSGGSGGGGQGSGGSGSGSGGDSGSGGGKGGTGNGGGGRS
jgi:hypothetical protein